MSDGVMHGFWTSLRTAEQRLEAEASEAERSLYRTIYGYKSRVMRVRAALAASGPIARQTVTAKLEGIKLDAIWDILFSAVRDMAPITAAASYSESHGCRLGCAGRWCRRDTRCSDWFRRRSSAG